MKVPFFRPQMGELEIKEVVATLESGWLTSGPKVHLFEKQFATAVGASYAVALNSCTAALHLAVEALGLRPGDGVLVPTLTFAATAEVVRYMGAIPILVDCDTTTGNMDLQHAASQLQKLRSGGLPASIPPATRVVGIMPVHVGGLMMNIDAIAAFAAQEGLWVVEDAAHAFPAAWRKGADAPWQRCGAATSHVACYSFYANKTITTGEGGMAVTENAALAERMRLMSLHGLSRDAWKRYEGGPWDYKIVAPGFKYNLTDIAAAIGLHQLARAEEMRLQREAAAARYFNGLAAVAGLELPVVDADRIHAWHLFPVKLELAALTIDRNTFIEEINAAGIGTSVHWRPLHLHPYYAETFGWAEADLPVASTQWQRFISLPLFAGMSDDELDYVILTVRRLCLKHAVAH